MTKLNSAAITRVYLELNKCFLLSMLKTVQYLYGIVCFQDILMNVEVLQHLFDK